VLRIIRCFVYFGVLAVVPAAGFLAGFLLAPFLNSTPHERLLIGWASLPALLGAGVFEARLYSYELRSLTPRPLASAGAFVLRLAVTLLIAAAAFLAAYSGARPRGLLFAPLPLLAALLAYAFASWIFLTPREEFVRGRKYRSFREVFFLSKFENLFSREKTIFFGGIHLPWGAAVKHWLILGVTGAGKTMLVQLLMQSAIKGRIGRGNDERGILYDNKTELVPLLAALRIPYKIIHPFDTRGVALDFRSMVPTHTHSLEIASILMTQAKNVGTDPFWVDAPRNLLASVLTSLRLGLSSSEGKPTPIDWDFRDVVLAMESQERIREVITRHKETRNDIEGYFDDPRLLANVMASVKTQMMFYRPIAACWHRATEKINLTDAVWGEEEYLLVLGNDEEFRRAINPINRVILTRYGQLALKRPRSSTRRIWFLLDEFPDLKPDPDLMAGLLTKGRSKGISVLIGVQTLLSVVHEYGREVAKVIMSQCQNLAILGLGDLDDETTEYAMRVIGQTEKIEAQETTDDGLLARRSRREQLTSRSVVLASEFADLPETVRANGLPGYYRTRSIRGFWGAVLPGSFLEKELLTPDESVPAIKERDQADHELEPWGQADLVRLGLKPEETAEPEEQKRRTGKPFRVYRGGKPTAA
jgi:hypothetical protein